VWDIEYVPVLGMFELLPTFPPVLRNKDMLDAVACLVSNAKFDHNSTGQQDKIALKKGIKHRSSRLWPPRFFTNAIRLHVPVVMGARVDVPDGVE
jgi:hypothetical protein